MYQRTLVTLLLAGIVVLGVPGPGDSGEPETAPVKLSGAGDTATAKFRLQAGLSTWQITHDGRSNFQLFLLSSDGKSSDTTLNEIGRYQGTQAVRVAKAGEYLINVKADGKWAITIQQPRPDTAPQKPMELSGKGPGVSPFVTLPKGISVFRVSYRGDSSFRVKLLDRDGRVIEQVAAAIGNYQGSKAFTIEEEGIYLLNVSGKGDWSLKVE